MTTLVVSATSLEVAPLIQREVGLRVEGAGTPGTLLSGERCDILITGVGQVACAAHVSRALMRGGYTRALQAGIAGSFTHDLPIGTVAVVSEEGFADLGAESHGGFLDLFEMGLMREDVPPFSGRFLVAPPFEATALPDLPRVRSVTVNRVLSEPHSITWVRDRYTPSLVNMEGAAFFYVALLQQVPFIALRSVSDMVGPRDKGAWRIPEAVAALDQVLARALGQSWGGGNPSKTE